jgi:hypothetical protein
MQLYNFSDLLIYTAEEWQKMKDKGRFGKNFDEGGRMDL